MMSCKRLGSVPRNETTMILSSPAPNACVSPLPKKRKRAALAAGAAAGCGAALCGAPAAGAAAPGAAAAGAGAGAAAAAAGGNQYLTMISTDDFGRYASSAALARNA